MAEKYFGTDGIRGTVGQPPLDDVTVHAVGVALGVTLKNCRACPRVLIGMDTRESGPAIVAALADGLRETHAEVVFSGILTTPAVAYLTQQGPYAAGVMVSASHNPYQDNGIKIFCDTGFKLQDAVEKKIEAAVEVNREKSSGGCILNLAPNEGSIEAYLDHLTAFGKINSTLKVIVDCANGAAFKIAPNLFSRLAIDAEFIACSPTGKNINLDCGSLHTDKLRRRVVDSTADVGIALDGDADRVLFIAENGDLVTGDAILLLAAEHLAKKNRLDQATVVTTVMANMGLAKSLRERGISMVRTPVGDKYVIEEMQRRGAVLGGEQSGHIIFADAATTGDGLLTACRMLEIISASEKPLSQLASQLTVFPQTLRNVRVRKKTDLQEIPAIAGVIADVEQQLGDYGRVLVRYSGTEPLVRVMVEAEDPDDVERHVSVLVEALQEHLGV